jgi:hypothetical protein
MQKDMHMCVGGTGKQRNVTMADLVCMEKVIIGMEVP